MSPRPPEPAERRWPLRGHRNGSRPESTQPRGPSQEPPTRPGKVSLGTGGIACQEECAADILRATGADRLMLSFARRSSRFGRPIEINRSFAEPLIVASRRSHRILDRSTIASAGARRRFEPDPLAPEPEEPLPFDRLQRFRGGERLGCIEAPVGIGSRIAIAPVGGPGSLRKRLRNQNKQQCEPPAAVASQTRPVTSGGRRALLFL